MKGREEGEGEEGRQEGREEGRKERRLEGKEGGKEGRKKTLLCLLRDKETEAQSSLIICCSLASALGKPRFHPR